MEVFFSRGIYLPELDLWLDSRRKQEASLISHAHSDHTARHKRPILTPTTRNLLADYLIKSDPVTLDFHEPLETARYTLTLYPAGHCLGSAQALVESKATGERVLYTGDFKASPSPINEPLESVPCDTLIIESTYGKPQYVFPPEEQVLDSAFQMLQGWLSKGERPIILGWRLGKAQELLHHLLSAGFDVAVEQSVYQIAQVYQEAGVHFPRDFRLFEGTLREGEVLVCPPGYPRRSGLGQLRRTRLLELTGWAVTSPGFLNRGAASLPYSDHADFNELLDYVRQVQPQQVYTVNGFPDLAAHLRDMGYAAQHLDAQSPVGVALGAGQMRLM